jgi:hypothetical protein
VCHPTSGERELEKHTIFFHDDSSRRMANARCRVFLGGQLVPTAENAGPDGSLAVEVPATAKTLSLEWAPPHVPLEAPFPFRRRYDLRVGDDVKEGVRRRLHSLGFGQSSSLTDKIEDFQKTYDLPVDGDPDSAFGPLSAFHDDATLPPLVERPAGGDGTGRERRPDPPLPPDVRPPSQGCVAAVEASGPKDCHFSYVLLDRRSEQPVANTSFILSIGDVTVHYGQTDGEGRLEHGDVAAGHYVLRIGDVEMSVPAIAKEHTRRPLIVERDR